MVYKVGPGAGFCWGMYWKYVTQSYVHLMEDDYLLHTYIYIFNNTSVRNPNLAEICQVNLAYFCKVWASHRGVVED